MKIVVDILDSRVFDLKQCFDCGMELSADALAIINGTPLPKGALITKGQAVELVEFYKLNPQHFSFDNLIDDIHNEKPIIEADRSK